MTSDDCGLNQVVIPISAATQAVVSLVKTINTALGTWYTTLDLSNVLFSFPVNKKNQTPFVFISIAGAKYAFMFMSHGYIFSPAIII